MKLYKNENTYINASDVFKELPINNDDICGLYGCIEFPHVNYYDIFLEEMEDPDVKKYLDYIKKIPSLSDNQERMLARSIAKGDLESRDIFIRSNLWFVVSIAKRYMGRGIPFLDLIQEGNLGLIMAVDKFDAEKNCSFRPYAIPWIREKIKVAIYNQVRNIHIPPKICQKIREYNKIHENLCKLLCREPSLKEIAEEMGITISDAQLYSNLKCTVSIDEQIEDNNLIELIPSDESSLEDIIIDASLYEQIPILFEMAHLNYREISILKMRFGLNDNNKMKLDDISKKFQISHSNVSQIIKKALIKIRKAYEINNLKVLKK